MFDVMRRRLKEKEEEKEKRNVSQHVCVCVWPSVLEKKRHGTQSTIVSPFSS
jgi:hypothetical protein